MKKSNVLFALFCISMFVFISCERDKIDHNALSGTTWKCTNFPALLSSYNIEYASYNFNTSTTVEYWIKIKTDTVATKSKSIMTYTISNDVVTFTTHDGSSNYTLSGTLNGNTMKINYLGVVCFFEKQ